MMSTISAMSMISTITPSTERNCLRCGYDLQGLDRARCPECGLTYDPTGAPPPAVPWLRRREIGAIRAYVATVHLVVTRPRQFAEQAWRWTEFDPAEGEQFRRATVFIASLSFSIAIALAFAAEPNFSLEHLIAAVLVLCWSFPFLWIATLRVPIPMPRSRDPDVERRIACLQKFCCAGLGLAVLLPVLNGFMLLLERLDLGNLEVITAVIQITWFICILIAWIGGCAMYLVFGGRVGAREKLKAILVSIALWIVAGAVATFLSFLALGVLGRYLPSWP